MDAERLRRSRFNFSPSGDGFTSREWLFHFTRYQCYFPPLSERLDQAVGKMDESYERKDIEKRSSPYEGHYHPHKEMSHTKRKKLAKMKRKKSHDWGEEVPERSYGEKIRHDHRKEEYGSQFEKPKSAAYASVVFPNNENQNFDRWKVRYQPVEPEDVEGGVPKDYKHPQWPTRTNSAYNRYAKKKLKMKAMAKEAKEKASSAKSAADLRRWQILKFNKNLVDKWSKVKQLRGQEAPPEEKHDDGGMSDKEKSLATNNWVTPKEHKENWPHFAYHRVTSSPGVQQRDAGAQPRHRSAYVAVSVVPTNSTGGYGDRSANPETDRSHPSSVSGAADGKPHPSEPHHKQNKLPDLFDHVLDEQVRSIHFRRSCSENDTSFTSAVEGQIPETSRGQVPNGRQRETATPAGDAGRQQFLQQDDVTGNAQARLTSNRKQRFSNSSVVLKTSV